MEIIGRMNSEMNIKIISRNEGMKEMKKVKVFPRDVDTLWVIKEIEACLGLKNKEIDKMNYTELIGYIEQITLMLLN